MRVAVTATGTTLSSEVDPRFGRAGSFLVIDTETRDVEILDNTAGVEAMSGAGVQAAQRVVQSGAEVLITGHCGPNAFRTLSAAGVKVLSGASGTVEEALAKLESGDLEEADSADVTGHWK